MLQEIMLSTFILEKTKKTSWQNRGYIQRLLLLNRLMKKQKLSPAEGQLYFILRNKYQEEYMALLKESNPVKYQIYIEEQQKLLMLQQEEIKTRKELQAILIEEEKAVYEQWMSLKKIA
jgi:L-rhamnose mutarotase